MILLLIIIIIIIMIIMILVIIIRAVAIFLLCKLLQFDVPAEFWWNSGEFLAKRAKSQEHHTKPQLSLPHAARTQYFLRSEFNTVNVDRFPVRARLYIIVVVYTFGRLAVLDNKSKAIALWGGNDHNNHTTNNNTNDNHDDNTTSDNNTIAMIMTVCFY